MSSAFAAHLLTPVPSPISSLAPWRNELPDVIEAIGGDAFPAKLLAYFNAVAGVDCCAIFMAVNHRLDEIASVALDGCRMEPPPGGSRYDIKRQLSQIGSSTTRMIDGGVSGTERAALLIGCRRESATYCVQLLRPAGTGTFSGEATEMVRDSMDLLMSMVAKHTDLTVQRSDLTPALRSLSEIQSCILETTDLSRREAEVCARILYGLTSCGIALDLGIGKESVMTYRKRAYHRIGIGSQRELLMWYLALWSGSERAGSNQADSADGYDRLDLPGGLLPRGSIHSATDACC